MPINRCQYGSVNGDGVRAIDDYSQGTDIDGFSTTYHPVVNFLFASNSRGRGQRVRGNVADIPRGIYRKGG